LEADKLVEFGKREGRIRVQRRSNIGKLKINNSLITRTFSTVPLFIFILRYEKQ